MPEMKCCSGLAATLFLITLTYYAGQHKSTKRLFRFNPKDASENTQDKDNDGFNHLKEYPNRTDPTGSVD
jgi:hypothetical protein